MSKTCLDCRHWIPRTDTETQRSIYGRPTMVDSCKIRGKLLCNDNASESERKKMLEEFGSNCPKYNSPDDKVTLTLSVGVSAPPDPENTTRRTIGACRACHFWVNPSLMVEHIDVNMGLCSKFGNLVPDQKAHEIAKQCKVGTRLDSSIEDTEAHQRALLETLDLDPTLAHYLRPSFVTADRSAGSLEYFIPPEQFTVSDKDVTEADKKYGIRAWRKLSAYGADTFLPVFNTDFFSAAEQGKIPKTGDDEHPEQYLDHQGLAFQVASLWMDFDETPMLSGMAGTGKTEFFRFMAWLMNLPFERFSITASSEIDDLAGKMSLENEETKFKPGRIPKAWGKPCVIVIDEPNVGPPEVWQFLRPLTDNSKQLVLDMSEGERVIRNDYAFLGMAINPPWDVRNVGANTTADADGSRLMHISVELPTPELEKKILRDRCEIDGYSISDSILDTIMRIATDLRTMSDDEVIPVTWGVRQQIKVARVSKVFPLRKCYQLAIADSLEPSVRDTILDVVVQHSQGGRRR